MSDSSSPQSFGPNRRGAPAPLVFNPESVLPVSLSATASTRGQTVNMPHVKRNITRRLKFAKQECDVAIQKITNNITQFIEEQIRNKHLEDIQPQTLREPFELQPAELSSAVASLRPQADDAASDDAGYEAELEGSRHSRQQSVSSSPASLRRPSNLPPVRTSSDTSPRKASNAVSMPPSTWTTQPAGHISRRLSRSIHVPMHSASSSRSASRSRSPLPSHTVHSSVTNESQASAPASTSPHARDPDTLTQSTYSNRRSSRAFFDEPPAPDPFLTSLHELTAIATDICETSISTLTSQPKACHELVAKVRSIGSAWDEHPEWPGRSWHMQVLLALASLTRVVEWWEAENKFWNFSDEGDGTSENKDGEEETFLFVFKPEIEDSEGVKTPAATLDQQREQDAKALMVRDELKTRFSPSKPPSLTGRRSRDENQKDITPMFEPRDTSGNLSKIMSDASRVQATEALREHADWARYTNIVLEVALDGDQVVSVNPAWRTVVGTDPGELLLNGISRFLHPDNWSVFKDASRGLQADGGNTKEIHFKLRVEPDIEGEEEVGATYCDMEGKGMLVGDKAADGAPSHTIWVLKALTSPRTEDVPALELEAGEIGDDPDSAQLLRSFNNSRLPGSEPITPFPLQRPINTALILCRICECHVPGWYFEKHNESCNDVHRFEADIAECNETIAELRSTVREIRTALDRASPVTVPDYRGMPIFSPSTSPSSVTSLLQFRPQLSSRMQRAGVRKLQQHLLEQLEDILQVASEISTPALKEEESAEPVERQLLLSPSSESKMELVRNWNKPTTEDPALARLVQDVEKVMFGKVDNVLRMRERIRHSEMIRRVWEASVEEELARLDEEEEDQSESDDDGENSQQQQEGANQELVVPSKDTDQGSVGSQSSTTSEYAFGRETEPTPMASASPIAVPSSFREPAMHAAYQGFGNAFGTRSSTPSSVSSPLALAVPITAHPPSFALESDGAIRAIRTRRSTQALTVEPRVTLTPPLSPMVSPRESAAHLRRHSTVHVMSPAYLTAPLSPRLSSIAPLSRTTPPSLKDFEIIKPISKGAFGSVFLAKKKATGDYYAIKVLKKADMITKNQVTNVKNERTILMKQAESPFVAKLYFTFQSKENLYLVMEYLNGGDCAALIKSLGSLPEEWTRNYVAEVVLGLEYLHKRGIVHRDLKPDNLLIDQHGHLKLTDFGLSRIGLLNRQTRDGLHIDRSSGTRSLTRGSRSRPPSMDASYLSSPLLSAQQLGPDSYFNQRTNSHSAPHIAPNPLLPGPPDDVSESSGSESLSGLFWKRGGKPGESPLQSFATDLTNDLRSHSGLGTPPDQKFVGTPDYLAPESILGISGDDPTVDWWALGVITYEFLYGIPPFHADSPEKVFTNIISGHIEWHEDWVDYSEEARDFMAKLMVTDPSKRLGTNGADEVKAHAFLAEVEWDKVTTQEAQFIPQVTDPESTDYFDPRGAIPQLFQEEQEQVRPVLTESPRLEYDGHSTTVPVVIAGRDAAPSPATDDFGSFSFKNVPVLKQANDDVIRKLKTESKTEIKSPLTSPGIHALDAPAISRRKSISHRIKKLPSVVTGTEKNVVGVPIPPSPSTSASSKASSPSRAQAPLTPGGLTNHLRRPSEYGAVERFKASQLEGDARRNSMPSRLRTASVSSADQASSDSSDLWTRNLPPLTGSFGLTTPPSSLCSNEKRPVEMHSDRSVTCLVVEDNPISQKILETVLTRMGCRCVLAADGAEAISVALGDIKFDCILMDLHMPLVDGEQAAKYIKSTNNKNTSTPVIAVSAYSGQDAGASNIFAASLAKPISKNDLLVAMRQLGFKTTSQDGSKATTKLAR